jgi:hypothetical protein
VAKWPIPKTKSDARTFIGKVAYYRRFIKNFSSIAAPWTSVMGKTTTEAEKVPLEVTAEMQLAFTKMLRALLSAPILAYPQFKSKEPFILDTDWSKDANTIGAVLSQKQDGLERVICYGAKKLTKSQANYPPQKGELLAVIFFMKYWKYYLQHRAFILRVDHQGLQWIRTMEAPTGMIQRWLDKMSSQL